MSSLVEELNIRQRRRTSEEQRGEGEEAITKFIFLQQEEMKARGGTDHCANSKTWD